MKFINILRRIFFFILLFFIVFYFQKSLYAENLDTEKVHRYLLSQQNFKSGLAKSFSNTFDRQLHNQSSTYDQALTAIAFLLLDDYRSAAKVLDFFKAHWNGLGYPNFFETQTGGRGIESTVHLGPNMWIAIACLQYDAFTGKRKYTDLAHKIAMWAAKLNHIDGGIAMGPFMDWAADWKYVLSAENNIDAYVVFNFLQKKFSNKFDQNLFSKEKFGIVSFLRKKIFSQKPRIPIGPDTDIMASDVLAFSILAFSPEEFQIDLGLSVDEALDIVESNFYIESDEIAGYDFTDFESKETFEREPMISIEWSSMIAISYLKAADYYKHLYSLSGKEEEKRRFDKYASRAKRILDNLDKKALPYVRERIAYPYATKSSEQVFPFAPWWRTPTGGNQNKLAGSLAGTCWRLFAEKEFNPFEVYKK